ncbi:response regulator transcription factor [Jiangella aurantiaca]|uniref:Response regulator transcription factor n=1 Tax=Jiangella aurantiaca TaxID=2530373 RepID=A0A4R5AHI8_9ACTN|nr:response regulator [Jiangella aurantiaca]TDD70404.1 response regulator transcription factor [Jiangella aurantiaca]
MLWCNAGAVVRRCVIVDDNERFLAVARSSLERGGLEVVGTATTTTQALELIGALRPDVVLVDIAIGTESGLDLVHRIAAAEAGPQVVLISTRREEDVAELVSASPAAGFVWKADLSARAVRDVVASGEQ